MATVPRLRRYYRGATTSCSARPSAYWFASRLRRCLRIRVRHCAPAALQARRRAGIYIVHAGHPPSSDLAHGQKQDLPGFLAPHPVTLRRSTTPDDPVTPRRSRRFRCCPQIDHTEGVVIATLEAHCDASSPAVYASRRALPHAMQDSLPAGGLHLCRAGVEPAGQRRKVSDQLILLPRTSPGARSILHADRGRVGGVVTEPLPSQTRASGITALGSSHARFAQAA